MSGTTPRGISITDVEQQPDEGGTAHYAGTGAAARRAHDLLVFCDGLEEAGCPDYARRGRMVARDLLEALEALEAERSVRFALQARCESQQNLLGQRAYEAMT